MTNPHAYVATNTWPAGTPDLGVLDLTYVRPVADASHHWAVPQLPPGLLQTWTDRVSGAALVPPAPAQAPEVYSGVRKVVRFNKGASTIRRIAVPMDLSGPRTFAVVGCFHTAAPNQLMTYGLEGGTFWNIYQGANGNFAFSAGKTLASNKPGDTARHVFLVVSDGANSVLNIDGQEWAGDAGSTPAAGFRMGASSNEYFGLDVEAVVVLPFAASAARRAALVSQLRDQYKI